MFDDPRKELRRLEQQLLAEEEDDWLDDELAEAHRLMGDDPDEEEYDDAPRSPRARSRNTDLPDVDLEEYSDEIHDEPKKKGLGGLLFLICLELLGIAAVAAYWWLFLL